MADKGIIAIYEAAKKLDSDVVCMSWNGFNLAGDRKSLDEVVRLQYEVLRLQTLLDRRTEISITATDIDTQVDDAICWGVIQGNLQPDADIKAEGRKARDEGLGFHESPYEHPSSQGLAWRIGWNERALEINPTPNDVQQLIDFFS